MAKKVRVASIEDTAKKTLINTGTQNKLNIDDLTNENKEITAALCEYGQTQLEEGELSVRLTTDKASALYSRTESFKLTGVTDEIKKGMETGSIDFITKTTALKVTPSKLEEIMKVLKIAGLEGAVAIAETYKVNNVGLRKFQEEELNTALVKEVGENLEVSYKEVVKYQVES